jgi:hypothetical protein
MDHIRVLKQAWQVLWRYRALWVFGLILALTTVSWEATALRNDDEGDGSVYNIQPPEEWQDEMDELVKAVVQGVQVETVSTAIAIAAGIIGAITLLIVAAVVARWVAETALIRMVDDYEETGTRRSIREGLRMGWSRAAWRLFLISLLIDVPAVLVALLLLGLVAVPVWSTLGTAGMPMGIVAAIGLFFLIVFLILVAAAALSLLKHFARRACVLDGAGVIESVRQGYTVIRQNLKDVGLMWLIMAGLSLGWPIVMIPIGFLLAAVAAILGGTLAVVVHGLVGAASGELAAVLSALAVGIPIFILILVAPLTFLTGLGEVFRSSTWTLTYRELRALQRLKPEARAA